MNIQHSQAAELITWMDVPAEHEVDFNAWYDCEHLQERVNISGVRWARRYRSVDETARRYLALYRAEGMHVFSSQSYQDAIRNQSVWSNRTLERITNTFRRVMQVEATAGVGTGSSIALILLKAPKLEETTFAKGAEAARSVTGVLALHGMSPDMELSTPIPREGRTERERSACLVVDAISAEAASKAKDRIIDALGPDTHRGFVFNLIWELRRADMQD